MKIMTAVALGITTFVASQAHAECAKWDISGNALSVDQSNGHYAYFDNIRQDGDELSGSAHYMYVKPSDDILGQLGLTLEDAIYTGDVEGTIVGNHAEFRVRWQEKGGGQGPIGVYSLDIDQTGRISGETYDFVHPNNRAKLLGVRKLQCATVAEAPPASPPTAPVVEPVYHRLGKIRPKPAQPPVEQADTVKVIGGASSMMRADACAQGFVWREAGQSDLVCVPPESRSRAAAENTRAPSLWVSGAYGPQTCVSGFVWREAFSGDTVCVTPEVRDLVGSENSAADSRRAH